MAAGLNDVELLEFWLDGLSCREIASMFGVSNRTVRRHLKALGVPGGRRLGQLKEERVRIAELYHSGLTMLEVGQLVGRHAGTVSRALKMEGIPNHRKPEGLKSSDAPQGSHGRESTYVNYKCRCMECRGAAVSARRRRELRRASVRA